MAAPVAIQGAEQSLLLEPLSPSGHHCLRRFLLHHLRVVNLTGAIIQNHDQIVPALLSQPTVPAAVDVQPHPRQGSARSSFAVRSALAPTRHHPRSLQNPFHPAVAEPNLMLGPQLLVKVLHIQIEITLPVQLQHPLHGRHRYAFGRRLSAPAVEQAAESKLLITLPPAPHMPVADAQDLSRLPPADLLRHRLQHHFLYFHRPLHGGLCVGVHALHGPLPPPEKRTYHLLSQPDISCATDTAKCFCCAGGGRFVYW